MRNTILIGAQWGDEGKGKVIDVLTRDADWVVRYQGGANAGHTVEIGNERFILHLIPSGILREQCRCVIGNGVVLDPFALNEELAGLQAAGRSVEGRLFISDRAHLVMPFHRAVDGAREARRGGGQKIGTTLRGIGPAYADKAARSGLRLGCLLLPDWEERLTCWIEDRNADLTALGLDPVDPGPEARRCADACKKLAPYVTDTLALLHKAMSRGERILLEGAQGTMLDIDFGTYPFVTSSSATAGGAATGSGIPPHRIDRVIGVLKAYTTRVGEGPFPTELTGEDGERLRAAGREFGATTGRPRRCGWLDMVAAVHAAEINGIDQWALTKLDVLDGLPVLRLCTGYRREGRVIHRVPAWAPDLAACEPVYEEWPGWTGTVREARSFAQLPAEAQAYVRRIETLSDVPVKLLSVGPGREQTFEP